jgi:hypothetical protein
VIIHNLKIIRPELEVVQIQIPLEVKTMAHLIDHIITTLTQPITIAEERQGDLIKVVQAADPAVVDMVVVVVAAGLLEVEEDDNHLSFSIK